MAGNRGGIHNFSVQEAQNVGLGQAGCIFVDTNTAIVAPTGSVFVAITFLTDTTLDASGGLIAEDSSRWANTEAAASAGGSGGIQIDASNTFPKGVTIYGRWSEINLDSAGTLIAYLG
tara:strand:+ start:41 stop:394 length:354 start_codon:yes stop_codon:yes gene_type:complete